MSVAVASVRAMTEAGSEPEFLHVTRATYDTVAAAYAERFGDELVAEPLDRALLGAFAELVAATGTAGDVADLDCGPGHVGAYLHGLGLPVVGVDLSPAMIDIAAATYPELRFQVGSMLDLDIPDASLAGVVAFYSIIHIPTEQLPRVFAEIHRVLSPGGRVLVAFQTGDGTPTHRQDAEWLGHRVSLTAWCLPLGDVVALLASASRSTRSSTATPTRPRRSPGRTSSPARVTPSGTGEGPAVTHRP